MHSVFYFNSTLSDSDIATLAAVSPDLHIQPECRCPPSHPVSLEYDCEDFSGTSRIPRVNSAAHDVSYINDGNPDSWWQSSNGEAPVNITISLGGLRTALVVVMQFRSLLPRAIYVSLIVQESPVGCIDKSVSLVKVGMRIPPDSLSTLH